MTGVEPVSALPPQRSLPCEPFTNRIALRFPRTSKRVPNLGVEPKSSEITRCAVPLHHWETLARCATNDLRQSY